MLVEGLSACRWRSAIWRNLATVAGLITERARRRTESRGLHASVDYPETDNTHWQRDTIITAPTSE